MDFFIQVAVWIALAVYLWQCRAYMRRRNRATWETLLGKLRSVSATAPADSDKIEVFAAENEPVSSKSYAPRTAWMHFRRAGVVLELADCAERNSVPGPAFIDPVLLAFVRKEAMQNRISALAEIGKSALPK